MLPVIFDETRSRFLLEISEVEYTELQIMLSKSDDYVDDSELQSLAGLSKANIDDLFQNHFSDTNKTALELTIAEIKVLVFLLSGTEIRKSSFSLPFNESSLHNFTHSLDKFLSLIHI